MSDIDRRKLQDLYPVPQKRSGMDARKPTVFKVPVLQLSLLLFLPIFLTIALYSAQLYAGDGTWRSLALGMIGVFCFVLLAILASVIMLIYARGIIIRNCFRSWIVEAVYVLAVIPFGFALLYNAVAWFGHVPLWQLFAIEAALLYMASLVTTLIARRLTR